MNSDLAGDAKLDPKDREDSCIDRGLANELPMVAVLVADTDENIEVAGEGLGWTLPVLLGGEDVMGNPKSFKTFMAFAKSPGLWNFIWIRRT